ncbi:Ig-like domain-containing protein, partial [Erwiniaceae bacterium CAU 1747]
AGDTTAPDPVDALVVAADGLTITGTGEPGATITVRDADGNVISLPGTVVADNGSFTVTLGTAQTNGETLSVIQTDKAGNPSTAVDVDAGDTTAPDPVDALVVAADGLSITGTGEAGAAVEVRDADGNIISVPGTVVADNGSFTVTLGTAQTNGETLSVIQTDKAGNPSAAVDVDAGDTTAPDPVDALVVAADGLSITGTGEPGAAVEVRDADGNIISVPGTVVADNGTFTVTLGTAQTNGETLSVIQTDKAGNPSTAVDVDAGDTTAPDPVDALVVAADGLSITGTGEPGAAVEVRDADGNIISVPGTVVADNGTFTVELTTPQTNGETLSVIQTDKAGNPSAAVDVDAGDTTAPDPVDALVVAADGLTITGTGEPGAAVEVRDADGNIISVPGTVVADNGTFTVTLGTAQTNGETLTVIQTDKAGNPSTAVDVDAGDTTAPDPVDALVVAADGLTITGTGEPGATITVRDADGNLISLPGTVVADNGSFTVTLSQAQINGETLTVIQTDAAGNPSTPVDVDADDTTPPAAPDALVVAADGLTITGTGEPGASVTVRDANGNVISVVGATVADNGSFTVNLTTPQTDGQSLSVTQTDNAGNPSPAASVTAQDTTPPDAPSCLSINAAGTVIIGTGEPGSTVTVKDANGNTISAPDIKVGDNGEFSVTLTTPQTNGTQLSVSLTDAAGNPSTATPVKAAIIVTATPDTGEVDFTTTTTTVASGTPIASASGSSAISVNLGNVISASLLSSQPYLSFTVGSGDSRAITVTGSVSGAQVASTVSAILYVQNANGSYTRVESQNLYTTLVTLFGTKSGTATLTAPAAGNYVVILSSTGVNALTTNSLSVGTDLTTSVVTVSTNTTGHLLTNDTSSSTGEIPAGTHVSTVNGTAIASSGLTTINNAYGSLQINAAGDYTFTLSSGLKVSTLPATTVFTYQVVDSHGVTTSSSLTITLHNGVNTFSTLMAVESVDADTDTSVHGNVHDGDTHAHTGATLNIDGISLTEGGTASTTVEGLYGTLTISADGTYSYVLNEGITAADITSKEVFSYSLTDTDGSITLNSLTIDLAPSVTGTSGDDSVTGSAYNDTFTLGDGADTVVYHLLDAEDATGGNGADTWTDFTVGEDHIDVSELLEGWNGSAATIGNYVSVEHTSDGNTVVSIDRDGTGTQYSSTELITLENVNVTLDELLQQHNTPV